LKAKGTIPLQTGLSTGKQDAQIVDACLQLTVLATTFACPIVCESLDFTPKKAQLRERGRKYARMLSGWAYSRFYELLESILSNRGISLFTRNPAYTSLIGLVKYSRMYGLSSDVAAAIADVRWQIAVAVAAVSVPLPFVNAQSAAAGSVNAVLIAATKSIG
jgi:IS605 OrfB family transposase